VASPACDAVMLTAPAFKRVIVLPEIEAIVGSELVYETDKPELAVAMRLNDASPKVLFAKTGKVIV